MARLLPNTFLQHLLIGAALGFVLGFLFSRNQKAKGPTK